MPSSAKVWPRRSSPSETKLKRLTAKMVRSYHLLSLCWRRGSFISRRLWHDINWDKREVRLNVKLPIPCLEFSILTTEDQKIGCLISPVGSPTSAALEEWTTEDSRSQRRCWIFVLSSRSCFLPQTSMYLPLAGTGEWHQNHSWWYHCFYSNSGDTTRNWVIIRQGEGWRYTARPWCLVWKNWACFLQTDSLV